MIQAIIFDFGNVINLFDNKRFLNKISQYSDKTAEELNVLIYQKSDIALQYERGELSSDEFYKIIVELCNLDISKLDLRDAFTDIFTPIETTIELIKSLKHKYKIGLLSDTSEWDFEFGIKKCGIFHLFDTTTVSFEVGSLKPDKKLYLDAINKLGLNPPECVFIDDREVNVNGATALGIHGINYISHEELIKSLQSLGISI